MIFLFAKKKKEVESTVMSIQLLCIFLLLSLVKIEKHFVKDGTKMQ